LELIIFRLKCLRKDQSFQRRKVSLMIRVKKMDLKKQKKETNERGKNCWK